MTSTSGKATLARVLLPVALLGGLVAAIVNVAPPAAAGGAPCGTNGVLTTVNNDQQCTYSTTGEDTFAVPPGVTTLSVTAIGAAGSPGLPGGAGGAGAVVTSTVAVPTGVSTLYVEV